MNTLKQHLEYQQQYIKNLLNVIKRSKYVPKHLKLLSEVAQAKTLMEKQREREVKKPPNFPVKEENLEEEKQEEKISPEEDQSADDGLCSIAVQESDKYPSYVLSKSSENSASIVPISPSKTSSSIKSGPIFSQVKTLPPTPGGVQNAEWQKPRAVKTEKKEAAGTSRKTTVEEQLEDNDDIVVINEEEAAVGGAPRLAPGTKQCPVCFLAFSPSSSQAEFENHVLAHFQD